MSIDRYPNCLAVDPAGRAARSCPRRGVSLHELLVTMGILTVLLPTALGWVHRAMTTHRQTQQWAQTQLVLARLAADLRRDFDGANSATLRPQITGDGPWLELNVDQPRGGTIRWVRQATGLVRTVEAGGETQQREVYQLPDLAQATVKNGDQLNGLVTIELWMKGPPASRTSQAELHQELQVEVLVRSGKVQSTTVDRGHSPRDTQTTTVGLETKPQLQTVAARP